MRLVGLQNVSFQGLKTALKQHLLSERKVVSKRGRNRFLKDKVGYINYVAVSVGKGITKRLLKSRFQAKIRLRFTCMGCCLLICFFRVSFPPLAVFYSRSEAMSLSGVINL